MSSRAASQIVWKTRASPLAVVTGTVNNGDNGVLEAGDTVNYEIEISNSGNTCLQDVVVEDLLVLDGEDNCEAHDQGTQYIQGPHTALW